MDFVAPNWELNEDDVAAGKVDETATVEAAKAGNDGKTHDDDDVAVVATQFAVKFCAADDTVF